MAPLTTVIAGLQIIASWLLSALAIVTLILSVILCIAFVECVWERGALVRAYTVKIDSSDVEVSPSRQRTRFSSPV